jgi:hypothetical protein
VAQLIFLLGGAVGSAVAGSLFDVIGPAWTLTALVVLPAAGLAGTRLNPAGARRPVPTEVPCPSPSPGSWNAPER